MPLRTATIGEFPVVMVILLAAHRHTSPHIHISCRALRWLYLARYRVTCFVRLTLFTPFSLAGFPRIGSKRDIKGVIERWVARRPSGSCLVQHGRGVLGRSKPQSAPWPLLLIGLIPLPISARAGIGSARLVLRSCSPSRTRSRRAHGLVRSTRGLTSWAWMGRSMTRC